MQQLLQKIQYQDDQQAFKQLYKLLFFRLYQFAYSYVPSKQSAEEIVNDVFLKLWQKRDTIDTIANFRMYLYAAVKYASLNKLRDKKATIPASVDELTVDHLHLVSNPESLLITEELKSRINQAIELLPPRCKLIFKLIKEDGLSYKEAASILEVSVKTVDAQLCIALKKLARLLSPVWTDYKETVRR